MMWGNDGWTHMGDWGWGWSILGMTTMLLFWGLALFAIFYLFGTLSRDKSRSIDEPSDDRAMTMLRERYARGEIDQEEYEARRRTLTNSRLSTER